MTRRDTILAGGIAVGEVLRLTRKGRFIGWYVRYKDADGRRKMRASHQPSKELARRYLLEVEGRVARGLLGIPEAPAEAPKLDALVARFLKEYRRPRIKDIESYRLYARTALRRALPQLSALRTDAIKRADIDRLRDALLRRYAPASVETTLAMLARVFSWAVREGIVSANPVKSIETPPRQALVEYLSKQEVAALLARAESQGISGKPIDRLRHTALFLALHLGLRKGELFGLRWSDVDLSARRLTIARSYRLLPKGGAPRHLRLPTSVVPVLLSWARDCPKTKEGLLFPLPGREGFRMGRSSDMLELSELCAASGCRPLRRAWHALRHTFASHFVMSGGNILALQKILGHKEIKMTLVYAHLAPDYLGEELERVNFKTK